MSLIHIPVALACCLLLATAAIGDTQKQCKFEKTISKKVKGQYLLYFPEDYNKDKTKSWPLVMFLHGAGERGDDLEKVKVHGPAMMVKEGKQFPFILVSPQCPEGVWWNDEVDMLIGLLDKIEKDYRVDKNREYVTGLSMGGYGTWALAASQPKRFAAIAPICGSGNPHTADTIKDIPMWVFHGAKDEIVPPERSREMVEAVKAAGGNPKFTLYPDVCHGSWGPAYEDPEFWKWLLEQKRK